MLKSHPCTRAVLLGSVLEALITSGFAQATEERKDKSLYDRLGGVYLISVVVEQFVDLMYANDVFNANAAIKAAMDRMPAAGLKYHHITAMVCRHWGAVSIHGPRHEGIPCPSRHWRAGMAGPGSGFPPSDEQLPGALERAG